MPRTARPHPRSLWLAALSILAVSSVALAWPRHSPEVSVQVAPSSVGTFANFAVAADHPLASGAGAEILFRGGNAADAAAATMLALGVANPASSGLGGGGFLLYYQASDQSLHFLDFRERAPGASTPDMFEDAPAPMEGPANAASQVGGLSSGVPGEPAGIAMMVERFGALPLADVAAPAERMARAGVPVSAAVHRMSAYFGTQMRQDPVMRRWFDGDATELPEGAIIRQPELARTLHALGEQGARAIYSGRIARAIVAANRRNGGIMTLQDLHDYRVVERAPLSAERFGYRWVTAPPPSAGGFTMLQSLGVLERLPARWRTTTDEAAYLHALAESWKGPFLDRQRYFGDPDHVTLRLPELRDDARLDRLAATFHPSLAMPAADYDLPLSGPTTPVDQPEDHGTSHLCVVDSAGNIAAVTTTVNLPFGARYTAAGMVMNDEMDDFARAVGEANAFGLVGGAPNLPGPGKRPISSMSPTIIFQDGRPVLCVGAAGGSRIITASQQVAMNFLVRNMNGEAAISAPRIHHQGRPAALRSETFAPLAPEVLQSLEERGHEHDPIRNVAAVQAIRIYADGRLEAASDPRKGGRPAGI